MPKDPLYYSENDNIQRLGPLTLRMAVIWMSFHPAMRCLRKILGTSEHLPEKINVPTRTMNTKEVGDGNNDFEILLLTERKMPPKKSEQKHHS